MNARSLCHADLSQLLIIDVQERLASVIADKVLASVLANINILLQAANQLSVPILHTEQYPQGLGPTHPDIQAHLTGKPISKTCFSSCGAEGMTDIISDSTREQWIIMGMETHICVTQTCMDLLALDKTVIIVEDGVCSRTKDNFRNGIDRMRQAGAIIANTESVLFEWLGDASHDQFRSLSKLIR